MNANVFLSFIYLFIFTKQLAFIKMKIWDEKKKMTKIQHNIYTEAVQTERVKGYERNNDDQTKTQNDSEVNTVVPKKSEDAKNNLHLDRVSLEDRMHPNLPSSPVGPEKDQDLIKCTLTNIK